PAQLAGPYELPPGRFAAQIWFGGRVPDAGRAFVAMGNRVPIAQTEGPLTNPTRLAFELPVEAAVSIAVSEEALAPLVQRIDVAGADHSLELAHDETRTIEIELATARPLIPVTVRAAAQFRPRDHEPGSTDARRLGCQVRIELK